MTVRYAPETRDRIAKSLLDYYNASQTDPSQRLRSIDVAAHIQDWTPAHELLGDTIEPLATYPG